MRSIAAVLCTSPLVMAGGIAVAQIASDVPDFIDPATIHATPVRQARVHTALDAVSLSDPVAGYPMSHDPKIKRFSDKEGFWEPTPEKLTGH